MQIEKLAQLFAKSGTYPVSCYENNSPVRVFQKMFPDDHYSRDLETFLQFQDYTPEQRGADLPWWGKKFFTQQKGFRTMVVAQDSLATDAGSIVLYAHLMPILSSKTEYKEYTDQLGSSRSFFNSWNIVKEQLSDWNMDLDLLYITDAQKVYRKGSWKDRDFDSEKSKELLEAEIKFCDPDLIVLLGASPLHLLVENGKYASIVDQGKPIDVQGKRCVVAPFFIGNGRVQRGFKNRLKISTDVIRSEISSHNPRV